MPVTRHQQFRRQLLRNTAFSGVGNAWAAIVALATLPLLVKGLGAAGFGTWALLQAFSARRGILSVADLGIGAAVSRRVAGLAALDDRFAVRRAVNTALAIFVALGLVCMALLLTAGSASFPTIFRTPPELRGALAAAVIWFSLQVPLDFLGEGSNDCLSGLQRLDLARGCDAIRRTLIGVATAVAALATHDIGDVSLASFASTAIGAAFSIVLLLRQCGGTARPSWSEAQGLFRYGGQLGVFGLFGIVHSTMDRLVVGVILGPGSVTLVEIATQVQAGSDAVLAAATSAILPGAAWLRAREAKEKLRELLIAATKYSLLVCFPITLGAMALAGPLVRLWVGDNYTAAVPLVIAALAYNVIAAPLQVGSFILQGTGEVRQVLRPYIWATILNLGATIIFVVAIGPIGAFVGTLVSAPVLILPLGRSMLQHVGLDIRTFLTGSLIPTLFPSLGMLVPVVVIEFLHLPNLLTAAAGVVTGGLVFFAIALRYSLKKKEISTLVSTLLGRPVDPS